MAKAPSFQWYPKDWETDENVKLMDFAEKGFYVTCLNHSWLNDGLPEEIADIARIFGTTKAQAVKLWSRVGKCFVLVNGRWLHMKQEGQRKSAAEFIEEARRTGKEGAASKWGIPLEKQNQMTRSHRLSEARKKGTHTVGEWAQLLVLCGKVCLKCGDSRNIVKDHVVPLYQNGSDSIDNIQPLCGSCNSSKGSESVDYRTDDIKRRLHDACKMPGVGNSEMPGSASSSASAIQEEAPAANAAVATTTTLQLRIEDIGLAIHGRHPKGHNKKNATAEYVMKRLGEIVKPITGLQAKIDKLKEIDSRHMALSESPKWREDHGRYADGLRNWISSRESRFEVEVTPSAQEQITFGPPPMKVFVDKFAHLENQQ